MKIVKLRIMKSGVQKVWEVPEASNVCTPVIYKGHVYWAWRGVKCVDFKTGQMKWSGGHVESVGSCILTSDERLMVWANHGDLMLVDTAQRSPDKYRELAKKGAVFRADVWPHLVLSNGRLFCRDKDGNIKCFSLGGE
jgi:outer membrane protein assembly factor BamB